MLNSILWSNEADSVELDADAQVYFDIDSIKLVRFCCVQDDVPGDSTVAFSATNIDKDPNFIAPASGNYRPEGGTSPSFAIDAGSNSLLYPFKDARYADLDYVKRVQNGTVDMGCYENGNRDPNEIDILIMCWIDESTIYHSDSDLTDNSGYDGDLADLQEALAEKGEVVRIGVYAPQPEPTVGDHESIFPHSLGIDDFDVLYNYPEGVNIVKRVDEDPDGVNEAEKIQTIVSEATSDFNYLRGSSIPTSALS